MGHHHPFVSSRHRTRHLNVTFPEMRQCQVMGLWRAALMDALRAQQTFSASSIPSSAWDDPAGS